MRRRTTGRAVVGLLALAALAMSACTHATKRGTPVCSAGCTGVIDGARYSIVMPKSWNGTLLLYSHGYRADTGAGPGLAAVSPQDHTGTGVDAVSRALLAKGYALAGSSYSTPGWAVSQALADNARLHERFSSLVGRPEYTYVWGSSMGGLVTELAAERFSWVDGAAPMCGVVAGPLLNYDNFVEAAVATKALLAPDARIEGWTSVAQQQAALALIGDAIRRAAADRRDGGAAKVVFLASVLGLPFRTRTLDGSTETSVIGATAQSLFQYVAASFGFSAEAQTRFGGNPSRATGTTLRPVANPGLLKAIRSLGADPAALSPRLSSAVVSAPSPSARAALEQTGEPTGRLRVPTITTHTEFDQIAIVANETVLRGRVAAQGQSRRLVQLYIAPPATAAANPPYGVAHCMFSGDQEVGQIGLLDTWVRTGHRPSATESEKRIGPGLDLDFVPPAWPSSARPGR